MRTVAFYTLGCKVNQYETDELAEQFKNKNYSVVDFCNKSDVYVINTCSVTSLSDRKSRQAIRRAKRINPDGIVVVAGCYSELNRQEIKNMSEVDIVVGTKDKSSILERLDSIMESEPSAEHTKYENCCGDHTRAFLKIQDGCNQFCSYCIIPNARGRIRSKPLEDVVFEARQLVTAGFREIVLTGIHVASYGKDFEELKLFSKSYNTSHLINLMNKLYEIDALERIRISSIEPSALDVNFIEGARKLDKLCPHYHVSLQSGCDRTLKRMNRKYTTKQYKDVINRLRDNIPDVAITTDIIVGFPGETDLEFDETYSFLKEINLKSMHVFKYSRRPGTPAEKFPDQIEPEIKEKRSKLLLRLSEENNLDFNKKYINKVIPVLFEQSMGQNKNLVQGLSHNYIKIAVLGDELLLKGQIKDVLLERLEEDYVIGKIAGRD